MRKWLLLLVFLMMLQGATMAGAQSAQNYYEQARTAYEQSETSVAIDLYEKAIEADPDFAAAYSGLGMVYIDRPEKFDDVVWLFEQAAALEPENSEHYINMCRAYFQAERHDWAEAACLKALSIDPNAGAAKMTLGWVYLIGKVQPADAVRYFKEIADRVQNPQVYFALGLAYARNNEQAKALDVITTLRSGGNESLASRLEAMIRPRATPEQFMPGMGLDPIGPAVDSGPSQIVKASEDPPPPPSIAPDPDLPPPGTIRIKLRAKMPEPDPAAEQAQAKKDSRKDEGYSTDSYAPLTIRERQERVRRMRGSSGSGRGQGTISLTPIPSEQ